MRKNTWQLQDAKSRFSNIVERAQTEGPQFVTKHGNKTVVILSFGQYNAMIKPKTDLVNFLKISPLNGIEIDITRTRSYPRDIDL